MSRRVNTVKRGYDDINFYNISGLPDPTAYFAMRLYERSCEESKAHKSKPYKYRTADGQPVRRRTAAAGAERRTI